MITNLANLNNVASAVIHLQACIVQRCPANGRPPTHNALTLLDYSVRIDGLALDELPNSIDVPSFGRFQ